KNFKVTASAARGPRRSATVSRRFFTATSAARVSALARENSFPSRTPREDPGRSGGAAADFGCHRQTYVADSPVAALCAVNDPSVPEGAGGMGPVLRTWSPE